MMKDKQSGILVDTDVISCAIKEDTRGAAYWEVLGGHRLYISFMNVAELEYWARKRTWAAKKKNQLWRFLDYFEVIESNNSICTLWATIKVEARESGKPIDHSDCWIAATALHHGIPLATDNAKHYRHVGELQLLSLQMP